MTTNRRLRQYSRNKMKYINTHQPPVPRNNIFDIHLSLSLSIEAFSPLLSGRVSFQVIRASVAQAERAPFYFIYRIPNIFSFPLVFEFLIFFFFKEIYSQSEQVVGRHKRNASSSSSSQGNDLRVRKVAP